MTNLNQKYQRLIEKGKLKPDETQSAFVDMLSRLEHDLKKQFKSNIIKKLFSKKENISKGLYVYGDVGRGKTYLLKLFLDQFDEKTVRKQHFTQFMQAIHKLLAMKRKSKSKDLLKTVIDHVVKDYRIFFVDELFIKNVADAMLVERIFRIMAEDGIFVIFSSNRPPKDLYLNGLQRKRFLPFIDMLQKDYIIYSLDHSVDFRQISLKQLKNKIMHGTKEERDDFIYDLNHSLELADWQEETIEIDKNRHIIIPKSCSKIAWFSFKQLCETPKSAKDYHAICTNFEAVIVTDIPKLDDGKQQAVARLINFMDSVSENEVKLIATLELPINALYTGKKHAFEFQRTASRIAA